LVYADPPWKQEYSKGMGKGFIHHVQLPYRQMTIEEIKALPVDQIVASDAILFLWVIDKFLAEMPSVMESWGFEYRTVGFVWHKSASSDYGENAIMSFYTLKSCEFCYIGVRGKPGVSPAKARQFYSEPKKEHSRKPDGIRSAIVAMVGDVPRVELFARQRRRGWDAWGDQVPSHIQQEVVARELEGPEEWP
jgi:site-specific DNA-methyltransferase (adenine-specific)